MNIKQALITFWNHLTGKTTKARFTQMESLITHHKELSDIATTLIQSLNDDITKLRKDYEADSVKLWKEIADNHKTTNAKIAVVDGNVSDLNISAYNRIHNIEKTVHCHTEDKKNADIIEAVKKCRENTKAGK
jgi:hypothetical protein